MFAYPSMLLDVLPSGSGSFFITDPESKQALLDNFATMAEYIKNTAIGDILIKADARIKGSTDNKKHIDENGLIMKNQVSGGSIGKT